MQSLRLHRGQKNTGIYLDQALKSLSSVEDRNIQILSEIREDSNDQIDAFKKAGLTCPLWKIVTLVL